jgi:predicted 2-oxoglutarate/Fe(II)-dependent dioxygenase YbiX
MPILPSQNVECYKVQKLLANGLDEILIEQLIKITEIIKIMCPKIIISKFVEYELRKVYGETKLHSDGTFNNNNDKTDVRSITVVTSLNDNYTGGVYSFPYQNIQFSLPAGSVLFFPPYWTHPHCVSPVENGKYRYIFSSWGCE